MPYDLSSRLTVGVASSALFDLTESAAVFAQGEEEYRRYQEANLHVPLGRGVAFPFIRRLLSLNDLRPTDPPVEVFVMSKNSPETGLRVMRSVESQGLPISRAIFTAGQSPYRFMRNLSMSLFLSANATDVSNAIAQGFPAGAVLASEASDDESDELRIAFDFDGVLGGDSAEESYSQTRDLIDYLEHEQQLRDDPIEPGPLRQFLSDVNRIQALERQLRDEDSSYLPRLTVSLITARNAPAHERAIKSLRSWGVSVDNAFFLGGVDKGLIVQELQPHIYFDDQRAHLGSTSRFVPSVHVPFGSLNAVKPLEMKTEMLDD